LAALDLRADVEQSFGCLIVQSHQVMQSMGRLMDWTSEIVVTNHFLHAIS